MKHTKGNWEVTGQSETGRYITIKSTTGRTVARVPWTSDKSESDADHYDAKLIAAAPKMLIALQCETALDSLNRESALKFLYEHGYNGSEKPQDFVDSLRIQAIYEATE